MDRGRIGAQDWAVGAAVAAVVLATALLDRAPPARLDLLSYAVLAAGSLSLVGWRRAPVLVLAVTAVCTLGYLAVGLYVPGVAYLVAVYAAARAGHRLVTVVASLVMLAVVPLVLLISGPGWDVGETLARSRDLLPLAWLVAAGAAGEALRQAERRAQEAERTREETARRRADAERLHIARELHDSLTHQISVISVQAEAAVHLAGRRGDEVPQALVAIRDAGREASRELRATLEALRDDDLNSAHGLDHVPDLVQQARSAGLEARLTIEGQRCDLPVAVDRAAYRVVQESLTNVTRHAGAATASVLIDYRPGTLVIHIEDNGTADPDAAPLPGVGLLGMRERVTALRGSLQAAPRADGGFSVHAELPMDHSDLPT